MNDINDRRGDQIDLVIDNILARRASVSSAGTHTADPLISEEALIAELASLTEMEWLADEVGDRIAMSVATAVAPNVAASADAAVAAAPDMRAGRGMRQRWSARSRRLMVAAAVVAVALAGAAVQLVGGSHGAARHVVGSAARRHKNEPTTPPMVLTAMTVVGKPGALRGIGMTLGNNPFLTCVTRTVCYTDGARGKLSFVARTVDGGATWTAGAAVPKPSHPAAGEWDLNMSCRTPLRCVTAYFSGMLETTDGFAHFRFQPIVKADGDVEWATCPTAQECVADVYGGSGNGQNFLYSHDGGRSWATAAAPAIGMDPVVQLRCDASGACIAALSGGDEENATVAALSSTDGGRTWRMSATYSVGTREQYWASCGDARHCVIGGNFGAVPLAWIHVAASGAISVRLHPEPQQAAGTGISCATASDCFIVGGETIVATHDGGRSWISVPAAPASRGGAATLVTISCPIAAGCIGLAQLNGTDYAVVSDLQRDR